MGSQGDTLVCETLSVHMVKRPALLDSVLPAKRPRSLSEPQMVHLTGSRVSLETDLKGVGKLRREDQP